MTKSTESISIVLMIEVLLTYLSSVVGHNACRNIHHSASVLLVFLQEYSFWQLLQVTCIVAIDLFLFCHYSHILYLIFLKSKLDSTKAKFQVFKREPVHEKSHRVAISETTRGNNNFLLILALPKDAISFSCACIKRSRFWRTSHLRLFPSTAS